MKGPIALHRYSARTTLPALDLERAKRFYSKILGLRIAAESADGVAFETGEASGHPPRHGWAERATFFVYPTPNPLRGGHTQMGFLVDDVESVVAALRIKGVTFEGTISPDWRRARALPLSPTATARARGSRTVRATSSVSCSSADRRDAGWRRRRRGVATAHHRPRGDLRSVVESELGEDVRHVAFHRPDREMKALRD